MIITRLLGGLGNQMFQFAFAKSLAIRLDTQVRVDLTLLEASQQLEGFTYRSFDLDIFDSSYELLDVDRDIDRTLPIYNIKERQFPFDKDLFEYITSLEGNHMVSGYWQSYKYFDDYREDILRSFRFKNVLYGKWALLQREIRNSESVMINVRRTDYLEKLDYHGVVSTHYLEMSMELIKNTIASPCFYVFSDDIEWCKAQLSGPDLFFVDESYYDPKYQYYLQLMSCCKHFILANSSFAWWSAYLGGSGGVVIAPEKWFEAPIDTRDLMPPEWLKI